MAKKFIALTSGTSWNSSALPGGVLDVVVHCFGAGGGADDGGSSAGAGGGAGGHYARKALTLATSTAYTYQIGAGGANTGTNGTSTWFSTTGTVLAPGGLGTVSASGIGAAATGNGTAVGDVTYAGGAGGNSTSQGGGGGGGAAGPGGAGGNGVNSASTTGGIGGKSGDGTLGGAAGTSGVIAAIAPAGQGFWAAGLFYGAAPGTGGGGSGATGRTGTVYGAGGGGQGDGSATGAGGAAGLIIIEYDDGTGDAPYPVRSSPGVSGTGAISATIPAMEAGDWAFMHLETANQFVTAPTGWLDAEVPVGIGTAAATTATRLTVLQYKATAHQDETTVSVADPGDHVYAIVTVVRGADPLAPIDNTAVATAASSTSVSMQGLTTAQDNCLILAGIAWATDNAAAQIASYTNASLTGLGEISDAGTTQGNGGGVSLAAGWKTTAGAVSATTGTLLNASVQSKMTLAIKPASAPPSTWHPGDLGAGITLSGSNKTATKASGSDTAVRGTIGKSGDGDWVLALDVVDTTAGTGSYSEVGLVNIWADLATFLDASDDGVSWAHHGLLTTGGATISGSVPTFTDGDRLYLRLVISGSTRSLYLKVNSGSESGPHDISSLAGTIFPAASLAVVGEAYTLDGTASGHGTAATPWDGASGAASLAMPLLSSAATTFSPALTPQAVSVALPVVGSTAMTYAPAVSLPPVSLTTPVISSSGSLYGPSVAPQAVLLALPALGSSAAPYGPTLSAQAVQISLPLIAAVAATYAPTMALTLRPPLLASSGSAFAPSLAAGAVAIAPPLLASTVNLYAPGLAAQGATVILPALASAALPHAPALAPQAISLTLPLIGPGSGLFAPSVGVAPLDFGLPLLAGVFTLHQPALAPQPVAVAPPPIASPAVVHAPTLSPQAATVALPAIGSAAVLHPPLLASQATAILLPALVSASIFYPPILSAELVTDLVRRVTGRASGARLLGRAGVGEIVGASEAGTVTGIASGRRLTGRAARGDI